jgi:hypothetical protein
MNRLNGKQDRLAVYLHMPQLRQRSANIRVKKPKSFSLFV